MDISKSAIAIVVGIVILLGAGFPIVSTQADQMLNGIQVINESLLVTNSSATINGTVELANEPVVPGSYAIRQGNDAIIETTNYTLDTADATIRVISNLSDRNLNITYNYGPSGYTEDEIRRTIIGLFGYFMVLGALVLVIKHYQGE